MKINAAIVREKSGPFLLEEVEIGEPGPREVRVCMVATGLCHTDLVARDQLMPFPLPAVLGHEGAGIAGCDPIIIIDIAPARLALAQELGATHIINGEEQDAVREIRGSGGVQYSIEATGNPKLGRQAVDCLHQRGICALVGVAVAGVDLNLNIDDMLLGRTVIGITEGDAVPQTFIPQLVKLYLQGKLPLEKSLRCTILPTLTVQ